DITMLYRVSQSPGEIVFVGAGPDGFVQRKGNFKTETGRGSSVQRVNKRSPGKKVLDQNTLQWCNYRYELYITAKMIGNVIDTSTQYFSQHRGAQAVDRPPAMLRYRRAHFSSVNSLRI